MPDSEQTFPDKPKPVSLADDPQFIDDETLAAWSNPNIKWSTLQKAARHDRLLLHIASARAIGRRP